jgi:signal transduction histidine kinase
MIELLAQSGSEREFWVEATLRVIKYGGKKRVLAVARDIDERKRMQDKLNMSEKFQAIGMLASEIVHDFNNQLTVVSGYANLLLLSPVMQEEEKKAVSGILQATQQGSDLSRQLLMFTHKEKHVIPVDLHTIIRDVTEMLSETPDSKVDIEIKLNAAQSVISGDPSQLSSAVLNMALNARDSMPKGGVLSFMTDTVTLDKKNCRRSSFDLVPGNYLELKVIDTGMGMDPVTLSRVFEPFFSTKGKGIGIGAVAVLSAITNHKGSIEVESSVGKGTVYTVLLPLKEMIAAGTESGLQQ